MKPVSRIPKSSQTREESRGEKGGTESKRKRGQEIRDYIYSEPRHRPTLKTLW
jgi:hypothetical protein